MVPCTSTRRTASFSLKQRTVTVSTVSGSGDWSVIKSSGETIVVEENGEATIMNSATGQYSDDYKSLEVPKPPASVDGFTTAPKEGVKPTSVKTH